MGLADIEEEQATVYRSSLGRRRFFTRAAALKDHTAQRFKAKHGPCECERATNYTCEMHAAWERIMPRYRRFIARLTNTPPSKLGV